MRVLQKHFSYNSMLHSGHQINPDYEVNTAVDCRILISFYTVKVGSE